MKEKRIGKALAKSATSARRRKLAKSPVGSVRASGTDWTRVRAMSDAQVRRGIARDAEARPTDANFWKKARVVMPSPKQTITIRLDADLLKWLRSQPSYQTRINAVLRTYMQAHT